MGDYKSERDAAVEYLRIKLAEKYSNKTLSHDCSLAGDPVNVAHDFKMGRLALRFIEEIKGFRLGHRPLCKSKRDLSICEAFCREAKIIKLIISEYNAAVAAIKDEK